VSFCGAESTVSNRHYNELKKDSLPLLCRQCSYKERHRKRMETHSDIYEGNRLNLYKQLLNGEIDRMPDGFISNIKLEETGELVRCMIDEMIKNNDIDNIDKVPSKLRKEHFQKYKLSKMSDVFGTYDLIENAYPNKWNVLEFHMLPKDFWSKEDNQRKAINHLFIKLVEEGVAKSLSEVPKKLSRKIFYDNKMGAIFKYYDSIYHAINTLFPNQYNEWEFRVPRGYYQDDQNVKEVMEWFLNKLFEDELINSIDDIPKVVKESVLEDYGLISLLSHRFNHSSYQAMNYLFPDKWKPWEFRNITNGFWKDPQNVREGLKWFVDMCIKDGIIQEVSDLANKNLHNLMTQYNVARIHLLYNVPFLLSMIYGEEFSYEHNKTTTSQVDDTKLDSFEEMEIHNIIASNVEDYYKPKMGDRYMFANQEYDETYVPDWIINNNIIIEYFGLWDKNAKSDYIRNYVDKCKRKIKYFKSLSEYLFIDLYVGDLENNCEGLIEKFEDVGIRLSLKN